ncbi:MAG: hypothetical protein J5654_08720 [Victivallales bacterium]|nr:hypothetical protein [Victivallales bacterium]
MESYLGLDLSLTATGFFLLRADGSRKAFEINTKPGEYASLVKRVGAIAGKIIAEMAGEGVRLVLMEDFFVGRHFAGPAISLAALGTIVRDRLLANGYPYIALPPASIKKFESGSGASKKGNMVKCVFKNHAFDTASDNIADACAAAYFCKGYADWLNGSTAFHKYQLDVLKGIKAQIDNPPEK